MAEANGGGGYDPNDPSNDPNSTGPVEGPPAPPDPTGPDPNTPDPGSDPNNRNNANGGTAAPPDATQTVGDPVSDGSTAGYTEPTVDATQTVGQRTSTDKYRRGYVDDGTAQDATTSVGEPVSDAPAPRAINDVGDDGGAAAAGYGGDATTTIGDPLGPPAPDGYADGSGGTGGYEYTPGQNIPSDSLNARGEAAQAYYANPDDTGAQAAYQGQLNDYYGAMAADQGNLQQAYGQAGFDAPYGIDPAGTGYDQVQQAQLDQAATYAQQGRNFQQQVDDPLNLPDATTSVGTPIGGTTGTGSVSGIDAASAERITGIATTQESINAAFQDRFGHPFDPQANIQDQELMTRLQGYLDQQRVQWMANNPGQVDALYPKTDNPIINTAKSLDLAALGGIANAGQTVAPYASMAAPLLGPQANALLNYGNVLDAAAIAARGGGPMDVATPLIEAGVNQAIGTGVGKLGGAAANTAIDEGLGAAAKAAIPRSSLSAIGGHLLLNGVPEIDFTVPHDVPGIGGVRVDTNTPDVLRHPLGAAFDPASGGAKQFAANVYNGILGDPTAVDQAGQAIIDMFKTQDPTTFARQQAIQDAGAQNMLAYGIGFLARNGFGNGTPAEGVGTALQSSTQEITNRFNANVAAGQLPLDAARNASQSMQNAVANALWAFTPFNPDNQIVRFPGLEAAMHDFLHAPVHDYTEFRDYAKGRDWTPQMQEQANALANPDRMPWELARTGAGQFLTETHLNSLPTGEGVMESYLNLARDLNASGGIAGDTTRILAARMAAEYGGTTEGNIATAGQILKGVYTDVIRSEGRNPLPDAQYRAQPVTPAGELGGTAAKVDSTLAAVLKGMAKPESITGAQTGDYRFRTNLDPNAYGNESYLTLQDQRQIVERYLRNAYYEQLGYRAPEAAQGFARVANMATGTLTSMLRTADLINSANKLVIQKIGDEFVRGAIKGAWGVNPADTTLGRTILGRGESRFAEASVIQKIASLGATVPDDLLRTGRQDNTLGTMFNGRDRYGNRASGLDRVQGVLGAPQRAAQKYIDVMLSSPTQHIRLNAAAPAIDTARQQQQTILTNARDAILNSTEGTPELRQQFADRVANAKTDVEFRTIANDWNRATGSPRAPSSVGQSRLAPTPKLNEIPDLNITNDQVGTLTRTRMGEIRQENPQIAAVKDAALKSRGVPKTFEEYAAWRDAMENSAAPTKAEPPAPVTSKIATYDTTPRPLGGTPARPVGNSVPRPVGEITRPTETTPRPLGELRTTPKPVDTTPLPPPGEGRIAGADGAATTVRFENGETHPAQYRVVSLDDLTPNHPDVQPRDRANITSAQQVQRAARDFDPARVLNESTATGESTPIVTSDGKVLSGNGRTQTLQAVRDAGGQGWQDYQARLARDLDRYGLTANDLRGVKDPVLVRENRTPLDTKDAAIRYAEQANAAGTLARGTTEQARNDLALMNDHVMSAFRPSPTNGLSSAVRNGDEAVRRFVEGIERTDPNATNGLTHANKQLANTAYDRFENALVSKAYGERGPELATRVLESPDADFRNIGNGIRDAAPQMARAVTSKPETTIGQDIQWALDVLPSLKKVGGAENYLNNLTLTADPARTPEAESLLRFFWDNRNSSSAITKGLREYANLVAPEGGSAGLFGDMSLSKADALRQISTKAPQRGIGGFDMAAGDGGAGYLSRQQRAVRDDINGMGGLSTGRTRDIYTGKGGPANRVQDVQAYPYRKEMEKALGTGVGDRGSLETLLTDIKGRGLSEKDLGYVGTAVNTELRNGELYLRQVAGTPREAKAAHDLAELERFAQNLRDYRVDTYGPYRSTRDGIARFGPDTTAPAPSAISATDVNPITGKPREAAAFTPYAPNRYSTTPGEPVTPAGERPILVRERNPNGATGPTESARASRLSSFAPRDSVANTIENTRLALRENRLGGVYGAVDAGNRIVGNNRDQTMFGRVLTDGLNVKGVQLPPVYAFAPFHIHSTQFWLEYFVGHPAMAFNVAHAVGSYLDKYGGAQTPDGTTVTGLTNMTTMAHLVDWAYKLYDYGRDLMANPNGNNRFQQAAKIANYGLAGNDAFIGPMGYVAGPVQAITQSATNPLMAQGKHGPVVDKRDITSEQGSRAFLTGVAGLANERAGKPVDQGWINRLTNPAQGVNNALLKGGFALANRFGAQGNIADYSDASARAYFTRDYAAQMGWDAKRAQAAANDIATTHGNPTTVDGKALNAAYDHQLNVNGALKAFPIGVRPPEPAGKPIYGYDQNSPAEIAFNQRLADSKEHSAQHFDAQTAVGREFSFSDASRDARAIAKEHGTYSPQAISAADQAREIGKAYGVQGDVGRGGRPLTEHQIAQGQQRTDASNVASDINTGRIFSPADRQTYLAAKGAGEALTQSGPGNPIRVNDLLNQPGNYYDTLNKAEAAQRAGNKEQAAALFAAADGMKNQTPETKAYFAATGSTDYRRLEVLRDNAIRANTDGMAADKFAPTARTSLSAMKDRAYFEQLSPSQQQAYDQYTKLEGTSLAQQYNRLTQELYAAGGPLSAGGKAFLSSHPEYSGVQQQYEAALHAIHDQTGVNPREVSNILKGAAGETNLSNLARDNAYYGLDPNSRQALDLKSQLDSSDTGKRYFDLLNQAPQKGAPGYTEWWRAHGAEYTDARNAYNAALQDIQNRTGVNPKEVSNQIKGALGEPITNPNTEIPGQSTPFAGSGGGNGGSGRGTPTRSANTHTSAGGKPFTPYSKSSQFGKGGGSARPVGSGGGAASNPAVNDFYSAYKAITDPTERALAAKDVSVRAILDSKGKAGDPARAQAALATIHDTAQALHTFRDSFNALTLAEKTQARRDPTIAAALGQRTLTADQYRQASEQLAAGQLNGTYDQYGNRTSGGFGSSRYGNSTNSTNYTGGPPPSTGGYDVRQISQRQAAISQALRGGDFATANALGADAMAGRPFDATRTVGQRLNAQDATTTSGYPAPHPTHPGATADPYGAASAGHGGGGAGNKNTGRESGQIGRNGVSEAAGDGGIVKEKQNTAGERQGGGKSSGGGGGGSSHGGGGGGKHK